MSNKLCVPQLGLPAGAARQAEVNAHMRRRANLAGTRSRAISRDGGHFEWRRVRKSEPGIPLAEARGNVSV